MSAWLRRNALIVCALALALTACAVGSGRPDQSASTAAPAATLDAWSDVDAALRSSYEGSLAYTIPSAMTLDEVSTATLLVSPNVSPAKLEAALADVASAGSTTASAAVSVTPRMRAELVGSPPEAFDIQPVHAASEQLLATSEPTTWQWTVTARQEGRHRLTVIVYRLMTVDDKDYWRQVAYAQSIDVSVTFAQRLARFDWTWLVGLLATGLVFPLVLGWVRRRRKARARA